MDGRTEMLICLSNEINLSCALRSSTRGRNVRWFCNSADGSSLILYRKMVFSNYFNPPEKPMSVFKFETKKILDKL